MEMNTGNRGNFDHKGKKANRNRKLALLAGMALSFGVAYGMVPGEVALAYKHLLDVTGGTYKVVFFLTDTTEEFTETYNTFSAALSAVNSKVKSGDTIQIEPSLADALKGSGTVIYVPSGVNLQAENCGDGSRCLIHAGDGGASVQYDNSNSLVISGTLTDETSITTMNDSVYVVNTSKIDLSSATGTLSVFTDSRGAKVGTIQLGSEAGLRLKSTYKLNVEGTVTVDGGTLIVEARSCLSADSLVFNGGTYNNSQGSQVTANSVTFGSGVSIEDGSTITANNVTFDASDANLIDELGKLKISSATQGQAVSVTIKNVSGDTTALRDAINRCVGDGGVNVVFVSEIEALENEVASMNPFEEQLPSADDIANMSGLTDAQKAKLIAAVQQAGKTAAAPAVTSSRAATAITSVLTNNVVTRTAEIRGFASAVDEGRPEPDKMWFQYKHTSMDIDGGDVYEKSVINTNNFQLGYDTQVGANDYLGAYIGTTIGNADFNGPARNGRIDIDNSFDFGVYGTHILPNDQYIDYMVHTGKFDSKLNDGVKYGTDDTGAMIGYGAKLARTDRLTLNPYIQLAYDKISVDSYTTRPGNEIKSDDSNNWTAKLGLNLIDASGLYGGVAYSRGLSGSYNAYINGVAMPASDNNANVLYLSLGYRANMAKNTVLDLSMEKTFMDYKGWTAAGKVNFYF